MRPPGQPETPPLAAAVGIAGFINCYPGLLKISVLISGSGPAVHLLIEGAGFTCFAKVEVRQFPGAIFPVKEYGRAVETQHYLLSGVTLGHVNGLARRQ